MRIIIYCVTFLIGLAIGATLVHFTFNGSTPFGPAVAICNGVELPNPVRENDSVVSHGLCFGTIDVLYPETVAASR